MRIAFEFAPVRWAASALRWLLGHYVCLHETEIHRRGPAAAPEEDRVMGRECLRCGRWYPLDLPRSPLAHRLARTERRLKKHRLRAQPKKVSVPSPLTFPTRKEGTHDA